MTDRVDAAAYVEWPATSPVAGVPTANPKSDLVFRVANSTASGRATAADIPPEQRGCYWRFLTVGSNVQFVFELEDQNGNTPSAPTLVYNQAVATGTGSAAAGGTLLDSVPEHVYCPANALRVTFISAAATGNLEAHRSGRRVGRRKRDAT